MFKSIKRYFTKYTNITNFIYELPSAFSGGFNFLSVSKKSLGYIQITTKRIFLCS